MHYVRTMSGDTLAEQMNPAFRKISFSDEAAIVTVSTLLRAAWTASPPNQVTSSSLGSWISAYSKKTPEEQAATPRSKATDLHTTWRDLVYEMFNHVFYDVHRFMENACMLEGDFILPAHEAFSLPFPAAPSSSSAATADLEKSWDVAVYLIPAYVAKGVTVKAFRTADRYGCYGEEGKELDKFTLDGEDKYDVWYILPGTKVRFVIVVAEDAECEKADRIAAVIVAGRFTQAPEIGEAEARDEAQWMGLASDDNRMD